MDPTNLHIATQFTLLVTQRSLAGGEVSRLATHRMIVNFGVMISSLLTTAVWPELTAMHALGKTQSLVRVHRTLAKLNSVGWWAVSCWRSSFLSFPGSTHCGRREN